MRRRTIAAMIAAPVAFAALWMSAPRTAAAPVSDPRGYVAYRARTPIRVDGRLDDAAWRDAPWTEDFVDIEGDRQPVPSLRTRAKMMWDDQFFYVGAELTEPHVRATLTDHDSVIFHDNDFEVFIDPDGDSHLYGEFEINALGTDWDLLLPRPYKDGGHAVNGWEIVGLRAAVHVDGTLNDPRDLDRGWSVELAFPWPALKELSQRPSPPHDGDQWRVNFSRVEWPFTITAAATGAVGLYRTPAGAHEHNWVWSPQHVIDMHRPEEWGYIQFSTGASGGTAFVPDVTLPARRWLHEVYYAQRQFRDTHGRWAARLDELPAVPPAGAPLDNAVLDVAGSMFEASVAFHLPGAAARRCHLSQDARIWCDERPSS